MVKAHWQEIVTAREKSAEFKTALDPLVASMVDEAEAVGAVTENVGELDTAVDESTAASDLADQWNSAMGTLTADISQSIVVGIFTGGGSPLKKLGEAFQNFRERRDLCCRHHADCSITEGTRGFSGNWVGKKALQDDLRRSRLSGGGGSWAIGRLVGGRRVWSGGRWWRRRLVVLPAGGGGAGGGLSGSIIISRWEHNWRFASREEAKAIEFNTRRTWIDVNGLRTGFATGEFFMQDWHIIAAIQEVNATLVATLWSIRYSLKEVIPPKMDTLHGENIAIQQSILAELQGIRENTTGLNNPPVAVAAGSQKSSRRAT